MMCRNPECKTAGPATRMCHHPACVEFNENQKPLLLCKLCDNDIHKRPERKGHLVLDFSQEKVSKTATSQSSQSNIFFSEEETETGDEDVTDGFNCGKKWNITEDVNTASSLIEKRLKRKAGIKRKSCYDYNDRTSNLNVCSYDAEDYVQTVCDSKLMPELAGRVNAGSGIFTADVGSADANEDIKPEEYQKRTSVRTPQQTDFITINIIRQNSITEIMMPAEKNRSLMDLLTPILEKKNIDLMRVNAFIENSKTPLPMSSPVYPLGGKIVHIKEKESSSTRQQQYQSSNKERKSGTGSNRHRRGSNLSMDETSSISSNPLLLSLGSLERKNVKAKFSSLMIIKDREKLDQILSSYNSKGLPQQPELLSPAVSDLPSTIFEMETDWRKIVTGASNLTRQQQSQQEVIWELLNTEIKYIQSQKVIVDLFMSCLINLQNEQILNDVEIKKIFSNINDVLTANCIFWRDYLMKMLKEARETHQPFNPSLMKDGFKKFPEIFAPYQLYCAEQEQCQSYIKSMYLKNELFRNFIMWAEAKTNICKRLKLNDLIVKPMQRLTRYHLLLRRIMEKSKDNPLQQQDMKEMISSVETFTQYVNLVVGQKQEHEKLVAVALKIDMYEGVEAPNDECIKLLQKYNANFDLTAPMFGCGHEQSRVLVYHSPLRYKESPQFKTDVECYLFTDLLLICKPKKTMDKLKVVKPPIRIDRLVVEELKDKGLILLIHLNEFNIPQSAFTLHADSSVIRVWMEHIKKAKEMYKEACEMASCHRQQLSAKNDSVPENMTEIQNNKAQMSPLISTDNDNELEENTQPELHSVDSKTGERQNSIKIDDGHEKFVHSWSQIFFPETTSSENEQSQMDKCITSILDRDDLKTKTFQRRTERRYLTADAIQELKQKERDPEIHKRLSWNLGTSAKTDLENRDGSFKQKFYITGSDQSIHNSSGVGSDLDLNPKNEPSEDSEIVQGPHQGAALMGTSEQDKSLQLSSLKLKSKSMTDIAKLLTASPSEIKDGISSVILPSSNSYQGLTNSQVSKLKMIMLLNTTDESKV